MSPQRLGFFVIGVGAFTAREKPSLAEEALATGNGERDNDTVADFQRFVVATDFNDFPHVFVAQNVALAHRRDDAIENMQVGATDRACGDLDDRVSRMLYFRVGHTLAAHVAFAVPGQRLHLSLCRRIAVPWFVHIKQRSEAPGS